MPVGGNFVIFQLHRIVSISRRLKRESVLAGAPILAVILAGTLLVGSSALKPPAYTSGLLQSSPIALTDDGQYLVNVNPDTDSISVFNANAYNLHKISEIGVGREPVSVAADRNNCRVFVANAADGTVSVVDIQSRKAVTTINVGAEPPADIESPTDLLHVRFGSICQNHNFSSERHLLNPLPAGHSIPTS